LAKNKYIIRHDKVCTHLHYSTSKKLGNETAENWYSHIPKSVTEHEECYGIKGYKGIERFCLANRSDITVKNKHRTCLLIDAAIPSDSNVIEKEAEKKLKYKNSNSANVEHEILYHTSNHWGHWNCK
jgi:hypothetical protein